MDYLLLPLASDHAAVDMILEEISFPERHRLGSDLKVDWTCDTEHESCVWIMPGENTASPAQR